MAYAILPRICIWPKVEKRKKSIYFSVILYKDTQIG